MIFFARSVSLCYVPGEDRIRWTSDCEDGSLVAVWFTRRHLVVLLPQLADWLGRRSPLQQKTVAAERMKSELRLFEHAAAQQEVAAVRTLARPATCDAEFLLNYFGVSHKGEGAEVILRAPGDAIRVSLVTSFAQLHKIIRELLQTANSAGWNVADPWQPSPVAASGSKH